MTIAPNPPPPLILMYHRVGICRCDPWRLSVSPGHFAEQLQVLRREREVVPLAWLADRLRAGRVPHGTVSLTFDDGYADVFLNGAPLLHANGCPATLFLVSGLLDTRAGFWSDVLAPVILDSGPLPDSLELEIGGRMRRWHIHSSSERGASPPGALSPDELHLELWRELKPLPDASRRSLLTELAAWAGCSAEPRDQDRFLTTAEALEFADPGFIDIGAHTVSHPSLPLIEDDLKRAQVNDCRADLAGRFGVSVPGFAYPFGDMDEASVAVVRDAGFGFACTTVGGALTSSTDPLRLPRMTVGDWDADEFLRQLLAFAA